MSRKRRFSADQALEDAERIKANEDAERTKASEKAAPPDEASDESHGSTTPSGNGRNDGSITRLVGPTDQAEPPTQIDIEVRKIQTKLIDVSPANERDPELLAGPEFDALVEDIRQHGQDQPAIVTQVADSDRYELIAGSRRFAAAKKLGIRLKAVIRKDVRNWTLDQKARLSQSENANRSRPTPWERAIWMDYIRRHDENGQPLPKPLSDTDLAKRLGCSRGWVSQNQQLSRVTKKTAQALAGVVDDNGNALMALQPRLASKALKGSATPQKLEKAALQIIDARPNLTGKRLIDAIIDRVHGQRQQSNRATWTPLAETGAKAVYRPAESPGGGGEFKLKIPRDVDVETLTKEFRAFLEKALKSDG